MIRAERGIGFEEIIGAINNGVLDVYDHPNIQLYPNQKIYVVEALNYAYLVPFVKEEKYIFLKLLYLVEKQK